MWAIADAEKSLVKQQKNPRDVEATRGFQWLRPASIR